MTEALGDDLHTLAREYGVATDYWDWQGNHVTVAHATIVAILAALGVDAADPTAARENRERDRWRRPLPPCLVLRQGAGGTVDVHVPHGSPVEVGVDLEGGGRRTNLAQQENWSPPREIDGRLLGEATYAVPAGLPLGYHTLWARTPDGTTDATTTLIVTPDRIALPERLAQRPGWGLATQLYSVRSRGSWGVGDLTDLTDLGTWSAVEHGADFVLVNPLHAVEPTAPMEPSPYLPTTRRFANPLYLRVERIPEYADLPPAARVEVDRLRDQLHADLDGADRIDRDTAWTAKRAALELVHAVPRSAGRELAYRAYCRREGKGLEYYATWCALAETHGTEWRTWPEDLQHPDASGVAGFARAHAGLVDLHRWLSWVLDEQLDATQAACRRNGMALGVMHDLAVGVHPSGAEAWSLQDVFAEGVSVGAPPDAYTQAGQDWGQPPWRPDRLAETAYAPFRAMVATVLRHAGGVRIDHVIGLFRLWWVPPGGSPRDGTYVRYDDEALLGILALEAHRADAVVVGEDVGTVEPWMRDRLSERGLLGTSILWFECDWQGDGRPLPPHRWRELCLASVTTHDLPPTAGYLAADHVRLRDRLGLLTRSLEDELAADSAARDAWIRALREEGLLPQAGAGADVDVESTVIALHEFLLRTPARLRCVALTDAVGDRRTQNQPGTVDEYPNWRVPLSGPDGVPLLLEDVVTDARAARLLSRFHS